VIINSRTLACLKCRVHFLPEERREKFKEIASKKIWQR
jgi:hypothetical protein